MIISSGSIPARLQRGLSLIELMIAVIIGSILILGLIQVFSASRAAYQLSQGIARNQENGRFAMDFLARDLRMAGHMGCVNDQSLLSTDSAGNLTGGNIRSLFLNGDDRNANNVAALPFPLRFDLSIQGFEANGTSPGDSVNLPATPVVGAAGDWTPTLPAELSGLGIIKGSDVVVLRYLSPEEETITGFAAGGTSTISYADESAAGSSRVATGGHGLYALADCQGATVFQASAAPSDTTMTVSATGLNKTSLDFVGALDGALAYREGQASLFRAESVAYYIAMNGGNPSVPALYRVRWGAAPGGDALTSAPEELVEGVDSMQLLYGEDSADLSSTIPTGYIDTVNTADTIGDGTNGKRWRRVGAVQLGLLVRSSERSGSEQVVNNVLQVGMTPPEDGNYRSTYETTIALRNRLFGN
ncbi:MAG TPA: pilus assembly protein PilW [Xanthomonadaceae bacterium]|nr:pilus assembly protein PilW [Xanthomonadaceae bacterium]